MIQMIVYEVRNKKIVSLSTLSFNNSSKECELLHLCSMLNLCWLSNAVVLTNFFLIMIFIKLKQYGEIYINGDITKLSVHWWILTFVHYKLSYYYFCCNWDYFVSLRRRIIIYKCNTISWFTYALVKQQVFYIIGRYHMPCLFNYFSLRNRILLYDFCVRNYIPTNFYLSLRTMVSYWTIIM